MYALTGQTRARRVCWLNVLSGAKGSSGGGRFCPAGQAPGVALGGWVVRGCPDEGRGRAFYFAADMREKPCRGKRTRCVCWQYGLEWRCWGEMSGYHSFCFCWSCCPVGQGQATTSVAWWIDDSRGGVGSKGLAERSCPAGQGQMRTSRICRLIGWNSCLGEGGDRYSRCSIRGLGG